MTWAAKPWPVVLAMFTATLHAHPLLENTVTGEWEPGALRLLLQAPLEQARLLYPKGRLPAPENATPRVLFEAQAEALQKGLRLNAAGRELPFTLRLLKLPGEADIRDWGPSARAEYELTAAAPADPGAALSLGHRMLLGKEDPDGIPYTVWLMIRLKGEGGRVYEGVANANLPFVADPAAPQPSFWPAAREFFTAGWAHILAGWDHLLFVTALALACALWLDLFKLVAAFVLAHSLTLTLAALGWARLPSGIVEPGIALSVVIAALANLRGRNPSALARKRAGRGTGLAKGQARVRSRLALAFGFGLLHGLGFAGGLLDAIAGMPGLKLGLAIASFAAGLELGHLAAVLPFFALLLWAGRRWPRSQARRWGSWGLAGAGVFYLIRLIT